jgi:hypothetical protein
MSDKKYKKEDCILLLQNKYRELQAEGLSRYPQRSDFEDREVVAIKAFLGPWPRALEAAGLKEAKIKPKKSHKRKRKNSSKKNCLVPHQNAENTNTSADNGCILQNEKGE